MRAVFLDCDPGHDDALALILAAHAPGVDLIGVTTTAGNQTLEKTTVNALRVLRAVGRSTVPVAAGAARPLLVAPAVCPEIHGETGLNVMADDAELGAAFVALAASVREARPDNGIVFMRDTIMRQREPVTLVATGCLTNVALLVRVFPEALAHIDRIVWLGGAVGSPSGNIGPVAEFNAMLDPHAAAIVLHNGVVPVYMIPLAVTHTAIVTGPSMIDHLPRTNFGRLVGAWLRFFATTYADVFGMHEGPPLHDPLAVALAIAPDLFACAFLNVEVECGSALSSGQTVCDVYKTTGRAPNVHVAMRVVDMERFWAMMRAAVIAADKASPLNPN